MGWQTIPVVPSSHIVEKILCLDIPKDSRPPGHFTKVNQEPAAATRISFASSVAVKQEEDSEDSTIGRCRGLILEETISPSHQPHKQPFKSEGRSLCFGFAEWQLLKPAMGTLPTLVVGGFWLQFHRLENQCFGLQQLGNEIGWDWSWSGMR